MKCRSVLFSLPNIINIILNTNMPKTAFRGFYNLYMHNTKVTTDWEKRSCFKVGKATKKRERERRKENTNLFPKYFILRGSRLEYASYTLSSNSFSALFASIHNINRKPKVFMTTLLNPMWGIQVQVRISFTIHPNSMRQKPCSPFAVMYGAQLDFSQREQKDIYQHHYSARSNLI